MPRSAMKSRNVSWEDGDEKRGLRKSGHLPGVTQQRWSPNRLPKPGRQDPPPPL